MHENINGHFPIKYIYPTFKEPFPNIVFIFYGLKWNYVGDIL